MCVCALNFKVDLLLPTRPLCSINYVLCAHYFNLCIAVGCTTVVVDVAAVANATVTTASTTVATITATASTGGSLLFRHHGAFNLNYSSLAFVGINAIATTVIVIVIVVIIVGGDVNEYIIGCSSCGWGIGVGCIDVVCRVQGLITSAIRVAIGIPSGSSGRTGIRF